jgi:AcrR family transcriptional regulator
LDLVVSWSSAVPRARFQTADPAMQERLLTAAKEELARGGVEGASLNRILERAGVSKGSFYYYFDDKADLVLAVLVELSDRLYPTTEIAMPNSAEEFWATVYDPIVNVQPASAEIDLAARIAAALMKNPEMRARIEPYMQRKLKDVLPLWQRGQELGAVRADLPVPVLLALVQSMKESLTRVFLPADRPPTPEETQRFIDVVWDLIQRTTRPDPGAPRAPPAKAPKEPSPEMADDTNQKEQP